jgi:hypothetical protein
MAHFLDPDDGGVSSRLLETELVDYTIEHWTPQAFGMIHIFTSMQDIARQKILRDFAFEMPHI